MSLTIFGLEPRTLAERFSRAHEPVQEDRKLRRLGEPEDLGGPGEPGEPVGAQWFDGKTEQMRKGFWADAPSEPYDAGGFWADAD